MKRLLLTMIALAFLTPLAAQTNDTDTLDTQTPQLREVWQSEPLPDKPPTSLVVSRYTDVEQQQPVATIISTRTKMRIALDVGYSYRTARFGSDEIDDPVLDEAFHKLISSGRRGLTYSVDIHGFPSETLGIGVRLQGHRYHASVAIPGVTNIDWSVNTQYVGVSLLYRWFNNRDNAWIGTFTAGYLYYNDKSNILKYNYNKGGIGATIDFGYDFRISGRHALGIRITSFLGRVKVNDNATESLDSSEISIGYRF